jgi:hypothetical protein
MCRNPSFVDPQSAPNNALLVKLVEKCFPEQTNIRRIEIKAERVSRPLTLPVFISSSIYFPGHIANLHIYEMR